MADSASLVVSFGGVLDGFIESVVTEYRDFIRDNGLSRYVLDAHACGWLAYHVMFHTGPSEYQRALFRGDLGGGLGRFRRLGRCRPGGELLL